MNSFTGRIVSIILLSLIVGGALGSPARMDPSLQSSESTALAQTGPVADPFLDAGCTVIYGADQESAFGGNNEDSPSPDTMVWFLPAEEGRYGRALFGYKNFIWQGGMNDQGLFFDALVAGEKIHVSQGDKLRYSGSLPGKALAECADVPCVKRMFQEYHAYDDWIFQFMFGDALGNSVIIEPETVLDGGAPFQVATNFYQSRTDLYSCRNCERYWTARNLFEKDSGLSMERIRDILDAVHLENDYPTQYSTIYDLKEGLIYLYHFHNYGNVVTFNLEDELAKGYHSFSLVDLFPSNQEFLDWAQPELDRLAEAREGYSAVELTPAVIEPYLGDYVGPDGYNMLFDYYSIAFERGSLVLKMLPDKAWMELTPTSETTYFHVSTSSEFEITFLPDENGEVNRFMYTYLDRDIPFHRADVPAAADNSELLIEEESEPSTWETQLYKLWRFSGTNTFKFLSLILGLVLLQNLLGFLLSRTI